MSTPNAADNRGAGLKTNLRKPLDPGFKRNLIIIGSALGVFGVIIVALWVFSSHSRQGPRFDSSMQNSGMSVPNDTPMPQRYQNQVHAEERQESAGAQAQGLSYIPQPTAEKPESYQQAIGQGGPAGGPVAPVYPTYGPVQNPNQPQASNQLSQGMSNQLKRLADANVPSGMQEIEVKQTSNAVGASGAAGAGEANGRSGPAVSRRMLVDKEYIAAAKVENRPSSDQGGGIYVEIQAGVLSGAELRGTAQIFNSEYLKTHFTEMTFRGQTYDIDATAIDESTAEDALSGRVDHKILDRYVMPMAMAALQGYANARAQTGSYAVAPSVPTTSSGTTVVSSVGIATPAPDSTQAFNAGVAAGLQVANQNVSKMAGEPPEVWLRPDTPLGIRFNAPVFEK
jgi:hypothetical protein